MTDVPQAAVPSDTAAFRATLDSVFAAPAYRWAEEPGFVATLRELWRRFGDWLDAVRTGNPVLSRLFVYLLFAALVLLFAHAAYVAFRTLRGAVRRQDGAGGGGAAAAAHDAAWYRRAADRAASEGRLLEALQLAFAALALTLDGEGALRYHPSMTPAECAAAARLAEGDRARLRGLVRTLYAHVFGGAPLGPDDYTRWRDASAGPWRAAPH